MTHMPQLLYIDVLYPALRRMRQTVESFINKKYLLGRDIA